MLNMPILKFEKSSNYLKSQLEIQTNDKHLILDIITNIGLLLKSSDENDTKEKYNSILEEANNYLQIISTNITAIEQLDLEITNINKELNELFDEQKKSSRTKEFYIAAFSNIKHTIILYSKKFQEMQEKLETDNQNFNNFININNFKYTFDSVNNSEESNNNYQFTGFSINKDITDEIINEVSEDNLLEQAISDEIINEVSEDDLLEQAISDEIINEVSEDNLLEQAISDEIINEVSEDNLLEQAISDEIITEVSEDDLLEQAISDEIINEVSENDLLEQAVSDEIINEVSEDDLLEQANDENTSTNKEIIEKIDDLTNKFKEFLVELSNKNDFSLTNNDDILNYCIDQIQNQSAISNPTDNSENSSDNYELSDEDLTNLLLDDFVNIEADEQVDLETTEPENIDNEEFIENEIAEPILSENTEEQENNKKNIFEDLDYKNFWNSKHIKTDISPVLFKHTPITTIEYPEDIEQEIPEIDTIQTYSEINNKQDIDNIENIEIITDKNIDTVPLDNKNEQIDSNINLLIDNSETTKISESNSLEANNINSDANNDSEEINKDDSFLEIENSFNDFEKLLSNILLEKNNSNSEIESPEKIENSKNDSIFSPELTEELTQELLSDLNIQDVNNDYETEEKIPENNLISDFVEQQTENTTSSKNNNENFRIISNQQTPTSSNIENKIKNILEAKADNGNLIISEKAQSIYLPYKISELVNYMNSYPDVYSSIQDVVKQEFILPFDYFSKHPYKSRFSEAYNILRTREGKNVFSATLYSLKIAKKTNLNPAIIAACKTQNELDTYLYYLDSNNLAKFKFFDIIYEVNLI